MIPYIITQRQKEIAEYYWQTSIYNLSAEQVQEALDWYNDHISYLSE